jgi:hypothetical protein
MNNQLLVGLVLIAFGIGLAILAYMILNSRNKSVEDEGPDSDEIPEPAVLEGMSEEELMEDDYPMPEPAAEEEGFPEQLPAKPDVEKIEPSAALQPEPAQKPSAGPRIQVATLLRDEVSGSLIVQIGDEEFDDPEELKASRYWTRLEYVTKDLNAWMKEPEARRPPGPERESDMPERKPASMIEQINDILQEKVEATGRPDLAVRLVEGAGGTARVLIGVNSYEIADVPNPEIKTLIRAAVAAWEATQ